MPKTPQFEPPSIPMPEEFEMKLPPPSRGQKECGAYSGAIEAMEVSDTKTLFFALPDGMEMKYLNKRLRNFVGNVRRRNPDRKYTLRTCKQGVVRGIGVWRTA